MAAMAQNVNDRYGGEKGSSHHYVWYHGLSPLFCES